MRDLPHPSSGPELPLWNSYACEVITFLTEEGYEASLDDEGDVFFVHDGLPCVISTWEADPAYFRLASLSLRTIENESDRFRVYEAATYVHNHFKMGRILVDDHEVFADVTAFLPSEGTWRDVFYRHLRALLVISASFLEHMRAQWEAQ
ncbi:hypothetical protein [Deinococcus hopiensis]|uniref:Sensory transduction regulator n=1 Tax=Deinococcus hopiensis KR-140 TaxID=695939 RepID=A0A1W1ULY9_9DEIO|nr:hypothetical protein [Deinococcus hopiensis]SMB82033.1 hypothetical protein SAMN00790413_04821 [Deinococcus hopiensis KR-140]